MFKKLLSFLFDEEVLDDEEQRLEEEIESITKPVEIIDKQKSVTYIDVDEAVDDVFDTPKDEPLTEPTPIKEVILPKPNKVETPKPKAEQHYEFSKVISPIFGYKEQPEVFIQVQPKLNVDEEKSVLGTVISPIYGAQKSKPKATSTPSKPQTTTHLTIEDVLGLHQPEVLEQVKMDITKQTISTVSVQPDPIDQQELQPSPLDFSWEVQPEEKTDKLNKAEVLLQLFEEEVE